MEQRTFEVIFIFAFFVALSSSAPQQQFRKSSATEDDTQVILGEGLHSAELNLQPSSKNEDIPAIATKKIILTSFKEPTSVIGKSENDPVDFGTDDFIADTENDQFTDAVAPSKLLKSNKKPNVRGSVTSPLTVSASPIYITIPIYLNKGDGQPIRVSVGGQEIPLTPKASANIVNAEPLSPTSQYNRLLKQNSEEPKQYKKSSRKSIGKKKRHHTTARKSSSRKNSSVDKQLHSYRFYF